MAERQDKLLRKHVKGIIEALLFASSEPLPFQKIRDITDGFHPYPPKILLEIIQELKYDYLSQQRAFQLEEIAGGYLLRTCTEYQTYIEQIHRNKRGEKLSQAALEVLSIVAYRQPITRSQIDSIRGVDSSGVMQVLLDRQLIQSVGRLEAVGRPTLFGVTQEFLKHFGLKNVDDLKSPDLKSAEA